MLFNGYNISRHINEPKKHIPINCSSLAKSISFFLPHVVFRICGMSFVAAFLGYWSLVIALINLVVHIYLYVSLKDPILLDLPMTILSPTIFAVTDMKSRVFLERSIKCLLEHIKKVTPLEL